jgi:hypothetical protein
MIWVFETMYHFLDFAFLSKKVISFSVFSFFFSTLINKYRTTLYIYIVTDPIIAKEGTSSGEEESLESDKTPLCRCRMSKWEN